MAPRGTALHTLYSGRHRRLHRTALAAGGEGGRIILHGAR